MRNGARGAEKARCSRLSVSDRGRGDGALRVWRPWGLQFCPVGLSAGRIGRGCVGRARGRDCELGRALLVGGLVSGGIEVCEDGRAAGAVAIGLEAVAQNRCKVGRQSRVRFRGTENEGGEDVAAAVLVGFCAVLELVEAVLRLGDLGFDVAGHEANAPCQFEDVVYGSFTEGFTYTSASRCVNKGVLRSPLTPCEAISGMYHFSVDVVKRSDGRSVVAAVAYPSGARLTDERLGKTFDYGRKKGIVAARIMAPEGAPEWVHDRGQLWNKVETAEKRKDAQLARQIVISLPAELSANGRAELIFDFVRTHFVAAGMIADVALHDPDAANPQPHAHVHLTMRRLDADGFGPKAREWNDTGLLEGWRVAWAEAANAALEAEGHAGRLDHRSLEAQRADWQARADAAPDPRTRQRALIEVVRLTYIPQPSIGRAAWAAMAKGQDDDPRFADRIQEWRAAAASKVAAETDANRLTAALEAEIAAERERERDLAAAEARREAEERERLAAQAAQQAADERRRRETVEQWEALRRERIDRAERRAARREEAERLKRDQWERERLEEAYYADEWRLQRDRDLSEGLLLDAVLGESLRLYWLGDERQFEELVGQSEALTALCSDPWHQEAAKVLEQGALDALRRGADWAETLREMAERLPQEAARLEAEAQFEAQRVASEAEAKRLEAAQTKCIQRRDEALASGDLLAAASWEGNLQHWAGDMERHSAIGARLEALDVLLASLEGQSEPVNVLLDPDRAAISVFDTLAASAIEAIRAATDAGADWCDTFLIHLTEIEGRLPALVEAERQQEAERAEAEREHAAWAERAEAEIAAERERERELVAAEARREAEVRERLAAQAARARAWTAKMSGGGLAALRHRAGAPARFADARDTALDAGDLARAGRAEAARQAWHGAATAARELMEEVEELEALKIDPLARAAATEIEPPMARAVVDEAAVGGGWADSLRTFIRDTIQTIRNVLAQFHARRAPSAPTPAPALAPAPRPDAPQPVAKPAPPAPAPKPPLPRIVFAELPSQGGLPSFRDWKRLARARLLWERHHNGGSGPLIDYLNGLAGEDRSYDHDRLFERLRANWQGNGTYRLALVGLLAGLGGSVDAATGYDYDPEPPPRFRPNGLLVLEMAKAREQCDGKLTLSGAAAVVRAVAQSVPLTFEDVAYAASEFSRDAGVPWIWKMVQEPASKPEAPAPPASGPSRREPDRGPGW